VKALFIEPGGQTTITPPLAGLPVAGLVVTGTMQTGRQGHPAPAMLQSRPCLWSLNMRRNAQSLSQMCTGLQYANHLLSAGAGGRFSILGIFSG
jgi:hypothetical protein